MNLVDFINKAIIRTLGTAGHYLTTVESSASNEVTFSSPTFTEDAAGMKHGEIVNLVREGKLGAFQTQIVDDGA